MRLESERLILRDMMPEDAQILFDLKSDADTMRYLQGLKLISLTQAQQQIQDLICDRKKADRKYRFLFIERKETGEIAGSIGYTKLTKSPAFSIADIGYFLFPKYRNHGYASEAMLQLMAFGFQNDAIQKFEASCYAENIASERVMQKCGMERMSDPPNETHEGKSKPRRLYSLSLDQWLKRQ